MTMDISKRSKGKSLKNISNEPTLINLTEIVEETEILTRKPKVPTSKKSKRKSTTSILTVSKKTSVAPTGTSKVPKKKSPADTPNEKTPILSTVVTAASQIPSTTPTIILSYLR